jgi:hypothetical protein
MKNEALARLAPLIGSWDLTMSDAWFLDSLDEQVEGNATFEWLEDTYVIFRWALGSTPPALSVMGYSDPQEQYHMLYHDDRGVARVFEMELTEERWSWIRRDADFHQRFEGRFEDDRIVGAAHVSEDEGRTWRKDFDLLFQLQAGES